MVVVEVCVESLAGVRAAARAGAARVELCAGLREGGTTASHGALECAASERGAGIVALIRPRGGDFLYSEEELRVMQADVAAARALGLAGVALGCLTAQGAIDEERTGRLIERARPLAVTFHRAFDLARDPLEALEALVRLNVERVLTSGQEASALEGSARIGELVRAARGRIAIVAAGGIRAANVRQVLAQSGVRELHLGASGRVESAMRHRNPRPRLAHAGSGNGEYAHWETDERVLAELFAALR